MRLLIGYAFLSGVQADNAACVGAVAHLNKARIFHDTVFSFQYLIYRNELFAIFVSVQDVLIFWKFIL